MVDEAQSFKSEQMTVCVRYTHNMEIQECFLGFVDCLEKTDAEAIHGQIKKFLNDHGISKLPVVAQCYDGAAVMAVKVNWVQQRMRQDHPSTIYIHCMAHKLTLVLIETCIVNRAASGFSMSWKACTRFLDDLGLTMPFYRCKSNWKLKQTYLP